MTLNPKPDTPNQEQEKINKSLHSSKIYKTCLKSGPTSDIQDDPYEDPFKNLSWLWEVPLVRSPDVINQDLLKQLLQQFENRLHSNKYLEEFQVSEFKPILLHSLFCWDSFLFFTGANSKGSSL